jgi:hypothetical protein
MRVAFDPATGRVTVLRGPSDPPPTRQSYGPDHERGRIRARIEWIAASTPEAELRDALWKFIGELKAAGNATLAGHHH